MSASARTVMFVAASFAMLLAGNQGAAAGECADPRHYANHVVRIERTARDPAAQHWVGSGWFHRSRQVLITNHHVASKLALTDRDWTPVLLTTGWPGSSQNLAQVMRARLLARDSRADIALVQLDHAMMGVRRLSIRTSDVSPGEPLSIAGYAGGLLHVGLAHAYSGSQPAIRYRQSASQIAIDVQGAANIEAFSPGASGSPVLDCAGSVVGTFSNYIDERYLALFGAWGAKGKPTERASPNAFAVRVEALNRLYAALPYQER
jgi:S1-C subfamily serine protease